MLQAPVTVKDVVIENVPVSPLPPLYWPEWLPEETTKDGTIYLDGDAYSSPENDLPGVTQLHLNENQFVAATQGVREDELRALIETHLTQLYRYPTGGTQQLLSAVSAQLNIQPEKVVISHGSAAMLRHLFFYLLKKNDTLLLPAPGWSYYKALATLVEARVDTFSLTDVGNRFVYDRDVMADNIEWYQPKVVLICSPNNPTGNVMPIEDFMWLVNRYPQVNFILDEAYYGFCDSYSAEQEQALLALSDRANLFLVRTFSKFYGLADLRVGFAICSEENGHRLNKIAPTFGLPSFSQEIAARRLSDDLYAEQIQQECAAVNAFMVAYLSRIPGMDPYQTSANFMLVRHDWRWGNVEKTLLARGFLIKRETINGARNYLRISYADMATMQQLMVELEALSTSFDYQ